MSFYFGGFLRQSTVTTVTLGPFTTTDTKVPLTGLSAAGIEFPLVLKAGGVQENPIAGTFTELDVTDAPGVYSYAFITSELDTVGPLRLTFAWEAQSLAISGITFQVLEEAIFDALFAASADGFNASGEVKVDSPSQTAIRSLAQGTASSNSVNTLTLIDTGKTEAGDFWNDMIILITSGPLAGLTRRVVNFDESLDTFTFDVPLDSIIQAGVTYEIIAVGNASVNIQTDLNSALADSVSADGAFPSVNQALYMIWQFLAERSVAGTTVTVTKPDGSTGLMTFTLDSGSSPTSITRAT